VSIVKLENDCDWQENMPLNIGKQGSPRKRKSKAKTYKESDGEDDDWFDSQQPKRSNKTKAKKQQLGNGEENGEAVAKRKPGRPSVKGKKEKDGAKKTARQPRTKKEDDPNDWPKEIKDKLHKLFYFPQDEGMRNHKERFQCNLCVLAFQKQIYLDKHLEKHKANPMPKEFVCGLCEGHVAFPTEPEHRNHMRTAHSDVFLLCPHCTRRFKPHEHSLLVDHIAEHSRGSDPSTCYSCGKVDKSPAIMKMHVRYCGPFHDGKCRLCPDFPETHSWKEMLKHFNDFHNGEIQYKCGFCSEWFKTKQQVRAHVKIECRGEKNKAHTMIRKICEICGKNVRETVYEAHKRKFHGSESIKCQQCPKVVQSQEHLKQHIEQVHIEHQCELCGFVGKLGKMSKHKLQMHTPEHLRPYQCKTCGKGFMARKNYEEHQNVHTGAKPFLCPHCGQGFASSGTLRGHVLGVHEKVKFRS